MLTMARLAFRDLLHDPLRTLFSAAGTAAVVICSLLLASLGASMRNFVNGAPVSQNLLVIDGSYVDPGDSTIPEEVLQAARERVPSLVVVVSPLFFRHLRVGERLVQVRAAPVTDWQMVHHLTLVKGRFPSLPDEAVVGEGAAAANQWKINSTLTISGGEFTICGIYRAPGASFSAIWIPIERARELFGAERSTQALVLELAAGVDGETVRQQLQQDARLAGRFAVFFEDSYTQRNSAILRDLYGLMYLVSVVALLAVVLGIFSTASLNLAERARQIGILRAVGFSGMHIRQFLLLRALLLAAFAFGLAVVICVLYMNLQPGGGTIYVLGYPMDFRLNGLQTGLYLLMTLGCATGGAWLSARWLFRDPVANLLRD